jgi:hypothetical protein
MRAGVTKSFLVIALLTSPLAALAQSPQSSEPLARESLRAAVHGCRASILDHATRDYLQRHSLTQSQLPPNFRERILPTIEPFLRTCDCSIETLSNEVSLEAFRAQGPEVQRRLKELVAPGGACAAKRGT